jgi:catechol-2,3-dioxygenase
MMPTRSSQHPCTELLAGPNARRGGTADQEGNTIQLQTLGHVVLEVRDLQCLEDFYAEALGMPISSCI